MSATASGSRRRVVGRASVSVDGFTSGPDGPQHDTWLYEHAMREGTAVHFEGIRRGADAALLGRTDYEGFHSVWPAITGDPATDPRTRDLGTRLDTVEKVVFSRTLEKADWNNSRVARDLEAEAAALKRAPGRDILVLDSASIIQALLRADLVDDLRPFPEGLPTSKWGLAGTTSPAHGAVGLHERRA